MNATLRKVTASFASFVLAVSLVPVPAFATSEAEDGQSAGNAEAAGGLAAVPLPDELKVESLPVPVEADYSWFNSPSGDTYTLSDEYQFVAFANLVNGTAPTNVSAGAVTFEGKTVQVSSSALGTFNLDDKVDARWTPIGSEAHPFLGTFDGNNRTINNFAVSGADRSAYLGLFGYAGAGSSITNVIVGSSVAISATRTGESADVIHHVGGVAGYCGGTMKNCTNNAVVTVSSAVVQTADNPQVVKAVGGVAGECVFDMSHCANKGAISVSATSDPVASVDSSGLVYWVGGVVGVLGDSSRIGTSKKAVAADPSKHGSISLCTNTGKLTLDTPSTAGKDRFGSTTFARSVCVGGVVGYSQGDVLSCVNGQLGGSRDEGYLRGEHASSAGGIVGSLRGAIGNDNPTERSESDDGMEKRESDAAADPYPYDEIAVSECTNYGDIYALNAAGGVVGHAGTHTTVQGCINSNKTIGNTYVVATRWNKPSPAGIVGSTSGVVAYCANFATIASGSWDNESLRTITRASGYYTSGIAGMVSSYSKLNQTTYVLERTSPLPEVYGCYNAGSIIAISGMRQRGIVGENGGYIHDNVLLKGVVENDEIVYTGSDASGTADRNVVLPETPTADKPDQGMRTKYAVALLNAMCPSHEWQPYYWVMSDVSATSSIPRNYGYPVLKDANPVAEASRTDVSTGHTVAFGAAGYTGGSGESAAIPSAVVTPTGGDALVENVDYYVKPDASAVELGSGYTGTVIGIGQYKGQLSGTYSIEKGKLSACQATIDPTTYNFEGQYPALSRIRVVSAGGAEVSQDEYEIASVTDDAGAARTEQNPPVDAGSYTVTLRVKDGSTHYNTTEGNTLEAKYRIAPADLMRYGDYSKATITVDGVSYPWVSSTDDDPSDPKTVIPYTGSAITPTVSGVTYKGNGVALTEGTDYRVVYGNEESGSGDTTSHPENNIGVEYGTGTGVVAVRFVSGKNFTNYVNMYFKIVDSRQPPTPVASQAMYRLYNPNSGEHFYTASAYERDSLSRIGWKYEGEGWNAPVEGADVFRMYNPNAGDHHYTTSVVERDALVNVGWKYEGVGWKSAGEDGVPLYRQYNPNARAGSHNYTTSKAENDMLVTVGWKAEGIGWYGA